MRFNQFLATEIFTNLPASLCSLPAQASESSSDEPELKELYSSSGSLSTTTIDDLVRPLPIAVADANRSRRNYGCVPYPGLTS